MRIWSIDVRDPWLIGDGIGQDRDVPCAPGLECLGPAESDGADGVGAARAGVVERAGGLVSLDEYNKM